MCPEVSLNQSTLQSYSTGLSGCLGPSTHYSLMTRSHERLTLLSMPRSLKSLHGSNSRKTKKIYYLWVHFSFDVLSNTVDISKAGLLASIHELPRTVESVYEKILARSRDITKMRRLLHIVVAAERPLTLQEMIVALAIKQGHRPYSQLDLESESRFSRTTRDLCGLFITIVNSRVYLLRQIAGKIIDLHCTFGC